MNGIKGLQCLECGAWLVNTSLQYSVCPNGHGRLQPRVTSKRCHELLPPAEKQEKKIGNKTSFTIAGEEGLFVITGRFSASKASASKAMAAIYRTDCGNLVSRFFVKAEPITTAQPDAKPTKTKAKRGRSRA